MGRDPGTACLSVPDARSLETAIAELDLGKRAGEGRSWDGNFVYAKLGLRGVRCALVGLRFGILEAGNGHLTYRMYLVIPQLAPSPPWA